MIKVKLSKKPSFILWNKTGDLPFPNNKRGVVRKKIILKIFFIMPSQYIIKIKTIYYRKQ